MESASAAEKLDTVCLSKASKNVKCQPSCQPELYSKTNRSQNPESLKEEKQELGTFPRSLHD
jgi:hypothetical protein